MHVHLTTESGETKLLLDGVDITKSVLAEGFSITEHPDLRGRFKVQMTVMADRLTVEGDLVVHAAVRETADLLSTTAADTESEED